jgi:UDP-N-acetylglucosamine 2-epimerase (non-hydrolysing)
MHPWPSNQPRREANAVRTIRPLLVLGTRPEAIKMAPLVAGCRTSAGIEPIVCFTGQHDEMLRQVTDYFQIEPDYDLKLFAPGQSLAQLTARSLVALDEVIQSSRPDCVVAQGDTTSVLSASIAAFYRQVPFVHVEAGLRTGDLAAPWPEEFNRRVASVTTTMHCAPTERAAANLRREGVPASQIRVTGNTVIDALLATASRERARHDHWNHKHAYLEGRRLVLITAHRRENHGAGLANVFQTIAALARRQADVVFVFPVHLNPHVQEAARRNLAGIANVHLLPPLAYPEFVWLMDRSTLIVSDSGGVQEEAPSLRRPVIALRDSTERIEAVEAGAVELVGCSPQRIEEAVIRLLTDDEAYRAMQIDKSPFGDGHAAERIVDWMIEEFATRSE